MADSHVISALREKRAKVSGCIARLERQLDQHRADLSHIDGVLRLFEPDRDLEAISRSAPVPSGPATSLATSYHGSAARAYGTASG
jgi:hypothetical protein